MFLKDWLGTWGKRRRARLSVMTDTHWLVHGVDFYRFFTAIVRLLPPNSVVGLAEGTWPEEHREFLNRNSTRMNAAVLVSLPAEISSAVFLPVREDVMSELAEIASSVAEPEIALHLVAANAGRPLLEWYDLPGDPVAIAGAVAEDLVADFARGTGGRYEREVRMPV